MQPGLPSKSARTYTAQYMSLIMLIVLNIGTLRWVEWLWMSLYGVKAAHVLIKSTALAFYRQFLPYAPISGACWHG
jgi:hypothetical protein